MTSFGDVLIMKEANCEHTARRPSQPVGAVTGGKGERSRGGAELR